MKKLLKKVMMCATMMAALVGFTSCEDDLDIQTNYPFEVEVMPGSTIPQPVRMRTSSSLSWRTLMATARR